MCRTVFCGFVGLSLCRVWEWLMWVCGNECLMYVREFDVRLWE